MSYYDRNQAESSRPKRTPKRYAASWTNQPLSNEQKAKLSIAARAAYEIQSEAGLVDAPLDDWRRDQTKIACGVASFRDATNTHFRSILAHFLRLSGRVEDAEKIWKTTGRVAGSNQIGDTHENREVARAILTRLVADSRGLISQGYVTAIAADKFPGKDLQHLTAGDLQDLVITIKARLAQKDCKP